MFDIFYWLQDDCESQWYRWFWKSNCYEFVGQIHERNGTQSHIVKNYCSVFLNHVLVKTVFGGKFPLKLLHLRVSSWSNSHTLVDKPCFCWLNTCDWCFNRVYHSLDQHADPAMSFFIAVGGYFPLNMGFSQGVDTSLGSHVLGMATNLRPGA